jgi:hypothetical protein
MDQQQGAKSLCVNTSLYSKPTMSLPDTFPPHDSLIQQRMIGPNKLTSSIDRW